MEDVHRFLRYVIPGLAFILEVFLLLLCTFTEKVICMVKSIFLTEDIGTSLMVFISSGVIGWFLSVIYRTLFSLPFLEKYNVDHRAMINAAGRWRHLVIRVYGDDKNRIIQPQELTRRASWRVFSSLWHGSRLIPEGAVKNQERQSSYMHSFGAIFVGSIIASLLWFIIHLIRSSPFICWGLLIGMFLSVLFISILWFSYHNALEHTQGFVEIVLAANLDEYHWKNNREPIKIFVFPRDLKD